MIQSGYESLYTCTLQSQLISHSCHYSTDQMLLYLTKYYMGLNHINENFTYAKTTVLMKKSIFQKSSPHLAKKTTSGTIMLIHSAFHTSRSPGMRLPSIMQYVANYRLYQGCINRAVTAGKIQPHTNQPLWHTKPLSLIYTGLALV